MEKSRSTEADIVSSAYENQRLPIGTCLIFSHLPIGTTPELLRQFFLDRGLDIDLDRISIRQFNDGASAKISFHIETVSTLVNWVLNGDKLYGREVIAQVPPPARGRF